MIEYNQLAVSVFDQTARRIYGFLQKSVCVSRLFVSTVIDLQVIEFYPIDQCIQNDETGDNIFAFFEFIVFSHFVRRVVKLSMAYKTIKVKIVEARIRVTRRSIEKKLKASIRKTVIQYIKVMVSIYFR